MIEKGLWSEKQDADLDAELDDLINQAWDQAVNDPYPDEAALLGRVYSQ
jgi:TPP-dependent pyruvate/acetoin dehydrogenase alpha subunit